jgi:hypothetical protein
MKVLHTRRGASARVGGASINDDELVRGRGRATQGRTSQFAVHDLVEGFFQVEAPHAAREENAWSQRQSAPAPRRTPKRAQLNASARKPDWTDKGPEGLAWCTALDTMQLSTSQASFLWAVYERAKEHGSATVSVARLAREAPYSLGLRRAERALASTRNLGFFKVGKGAGGKNCYHLTLPAGYSAHVSRVSAIAPRRLR